MKKVEADMIPAVLDAIVGSTSANGDTHLDDELDYMRIDRDALLALADELECDGECDGCDMSDGIWCDAQGYAARRIRKALGVCCEG